jgi:hypothetical protein
MDDHTAPSSRKAVHGRVATRPWPSVVEITRVFPVNPLIPVRDPLTGFDGVDTPNRLDVPQWRC